MPKILSPWAKLISWLTQRRPRSGVRFLEGLAELPATQRQVRIPTITDPRGVDFDAYKRLKQTDRMADIEGRAIRAFEALSVMMTNTCINYQTILPPVRGEHLAFGDTGVVIYSNGVLGARATSKVGRLRCRRVLRAARRGYGYHLEATLQGIFELTAPAEVE